MSTSPQADDVVSTDRPTIRVFISSPSDVRPERLISERVVQRLDREFSYHFRIEAMLWEREPLVAGEHFQDRIVPPHETDIVVVILWSRLGMTLPEDKYKGALSGGAVTGTEWEFEDALASYRELRLPDLLLYRKKAEITGSLEDEAAVQERLGQKRQVEEFMTRWTRSADGSAFTAASWEFADAAAFEEQLENHLRELIRRRLSGAEQSPAGIRWHQGSPFRGLQSFDLDHAAVFFGRTRARNEVRELLARQAERGSAFVLVMGASGSGKSSLVKAGVLADLKLPGMIGRVALCRHAILRPADGEGDLIGGLAAALLAPKALPELTRLQYDVASLADQLRDNPKQAVFAVRQGLAAAGEAAKLTEIAEARLLVVVDQLEELFTLDTITPAEREGFVAALAELARSGLVWVIATLRSDLFDRLETVPALAELSAGEARYLLTAPNDGELGQIITRPAREAGLRFEADAASGTSLDDVLREAAGRDPNALPLLSYVLDLLWQRRRPEDGVLTFAAYQELGGLNGAIGRRAEDVFTALPEDVQAAFPQVLRALVTVGQGAKGQATARMAARADFPPNTPAGALVEALLAPEARLLVADDDGGMNRRTPISTARNIRLDCTKKCESHLRSEARNAVACNAMKALKHTIIIFPTLVAATLTGLLSLRAVPTVITKMYDFGFRVTPDEYRSVLFFVFSFVFVVTTIVVGSVAVKIIIKRSPSSMAHAISDTIIILFSTFIGGASALAITILLISKYISDLNEFATVTLYSIGLIFGLFASLSSIYRMRRNLLEKYGTQTMLHAAIGILKSKLSAHSDESRELVLLTEWETTPNLAKFNNGQIGLLRVAHEAVLTHWNRAREQVAQDRNDLQLRARLEQAAALWKAAVEHYRPTMLLNPGFPLLEAESLLKRRSGELDETTISYVAASSIVASANDRRRRRQLYVATTMFGVLAVLASAFGWFAMKQQNEANGARQEAEKLIRYMVLDLRDRLKSMGRDDLLREVSQLAMAYFETSSQYSRDGVGARSVATNYANKGDVLRDNKFHQEAVSYYRQAIAIREMMADISADRSDLLEELLNDVDRLAVALVAQGASTEALEQYRRSLAISERLTAHDPASTQWQRRLASSHYNLGKVLQAQGDHAGALAEFRKSLAIAKRLAARDPANTQWQRALGVTHGTLGWTLILNGDFAEGRKETEAAHSLAPDDFAWMVNLGHTYLLSGDGVTARSWYQKALPKIRNEAELKSTIIDDFDIFIGKGWKVAECRQMKDWVVAE
ncbi:tetratricopeptide repeat protein, partial [Paramagnetospirillum marisnigri]|uniref:tetratricopeptide repeat protein n=1 Tax=Paramagnetospirillum marisnigri TaxID=1285242 RepID=UPI000AEA901C